LLKRKKTFFGSDLMPGADDVDMPEAAKNTPASSTTKPRKTAKKRNASSDAENEKASKRAATTSEVVTAYYVPNLPTSTPVVIPSAVSGLVVSHTVDGAKSILFDTFFARSVNDETSQKQAMKRVEELFESALVIDMSVPDFLHVTNGPPNILKKNPKDARAKLNTGDKKLFVCRDFPDNVLFRSVALIVAPDQTSAARRVEAHTANYKTYVENRPPKIVDVAGKTGVIEEIDLSSERFYPLVDGSLY
jgi:hypothetical protein